MNLNSAKIFALVVSRGSFSAATKFSGIPVATVSRRVTELETSLNVRLLERSTRKLRLTEAGALLYEYVSRGVEEIDAGILALQENEKDLKGRLRFSIPPSFEPIWTLIERFQSLYKNIEIDLIVSERKLDFIEDGIDIALRVGNVSSQSAIARLLVAYRHKLVASPEFLNTHSIQNPKNIPLQHCAAWSKSMNQVEWVLGNQTITFTPFLRANDYMHMRHLALRHRCITELPPFLCQAALEKGTLIEVLPEHPMPEQQINLVYPNSKRVSRITRVFIDYCIENFEPHLEE